MIEQLSQLWDIILLSDEETEYRLEHITSARGPVSIHLTGGRPGRAAQPLDRVGRIETHSHDRLRVEMDRLALVYQVALIQIEHVELAALASTSTSRGPRVIDLHDVLLSDGPHTAEDRVEQALIARHEAVLTCSPEDARLLTHPRVAIVPNGFTRTPSKYRPSRGSRMILFTGPFRFQPNLSGVVAFLEGVYPHLLTEVPALGLTILGGKASGAVAKKYACFDQRGVTLIEQPAEMEPWLDRCAVTINPVPDTRGSCVKVIESIGFGRVCISTDAGARSFRELGARSLITVPSVSDFRAPLQRLLLDEDFRIALEPPDERILSGLTWESVSRGLLNTYQGWFGNNGARSAGSRENH